MSDKIIRNPHPDFKKVEASRPAWDLNSKLRFIQTPLPSWTPGSGPNQLANQSATGSEKHVSINPTDPERPSTFNYKLLISAITPRPIAFISSYLPDAKDPDDRSLDEGNLAPFSYFNVINHDPPLFTVGFASPVAEDSIKKDTLRNVLASHECVVNIISEHFLEAANATSVNAPMDVDEWAVSGLTKVWDCETVPRCPRIKEAIFSIECRVEAVQEFESRREPGRKTGTLVVLEGTRFWVREDAINEEKNIVDPAVLRPVSRLGGITYGRTTEVMELPRPDFEKDIGGYKGVEKAGKNREAKNKSAT